MRYDHLRVPPVRRAACLRRDDEWNVKFRNGADVNSNFLCVAASGPARIFASRDLSHLLIHTISRENIAASACARVESIDIYSLQSRMITDRKSYHMVHCKFPRDAKTLSQTRASSVATRAPRSDCIASRAARRPESSAPCTVCGVDRASYAVCSPAKSTQPPHTAVASST